MTTMHKWWCVECNYCGEYIAVQLRRENETSPPALGGQARCDACGKSPVITGLTARPCERRALRRPDATTPTGYTE